MDRRETEYLRQPGGWNGLDRARALVDQLLVTEGRLEVLRRRLRELAET